MKKIKETFHESLRAIYSDYQQKKTKKRKLRKRKESTREKENDLSMIEYLNAASELLLKYRLFWKFRDNRQYKFLKHVRIP